MNRHVSEPNMLYIHDGGSTVAQLPCLQDMKDVYKNGNWPKILKIRKLTSHSQKSRLSVTNKTRFGNNMRRAVSGAPFLCYKWPPIYEEHRWCSCMLALQYIYLLSFNECVWPIHLQLYGATPVLLDKVRTVQMSLQRQDVPCELPLIHHCVHRQVCFMMENPSSDTLRSAPLGYIRPMTPSPLDLLL